MSKFRLCILFFCFVVIISCQPPQLEFTNDISIKLGGELPGDAYLLLEDATGLTLATLKVNGAGVYSFGEENYTQNLNYPYQVYLFRDSNSNGSFDAAAEAASSFLLSRIDFSSFTSLTTQIPTQNITRYQGSVSFESSMGSDPDRRYIYIHNRNDRAQRLIPLANNGVFDIYDKGFEDPGHIFLFAAYDTNGNGQIDILGDRIAILASPAGTGGNLGNLELIKLTGWFDPAPYAIDSGEALILEVEDVAADSQMFSPVNPEGHFEIYACANRYIGLSLYKLFNVQAASYDDILKDSSFRGSLSSPREYTSSGVVNIDNFVEITTRQPKVLLLEYSSGDPETPNQSDYVMLQATKALAGCGMPYDTGDLSTFSVNLESVEAYTVVAITAESLDLMLDTVEIDALKTFVNRGGGLVFLNRSFNANLNPLIGTTNVAWPAYGAESAQAGDDENNTYEYGVEFTADFFPGLSGLKEEVYIGYQEFTLEAEAEVLAVSIRNGIPLLWRYSYGDGKVLYWNSTQPGTFYYRGMILQSLLDVMPAGIIPIMNAATFIIDDFPMPLYDYLIQEPVASEYDDMDQEEFYTTVWLPDMLGLADTHGFKYTFAIPFNYNTLIDPPFDFDEWLYAEDEFENPLCPYYGNLVKGQGHELALHGYNHISLSLTPAYEGGAVWENESQMVAALTEARDRWILDFGELPVSYIPPHNKYDSTGLSALHTVFPGIENLCGALDSTYDQVYYAAGFRSEFKAEDLNNNFLTVPRYTVGYFDSLDKRYIVASQLSLMGLWTHYVHPDDIYNTLANNPEALPAWLRNPDDLNWRADKNVAGDGFYFQLASFLNWVTSEYPWIEWKLARDLNSMIPAYNNLDVEIMEHRVAGNLAQLQIYSTQSDASLMLRVAEGNTISAGGLMNVTAEYEEPGAGYTFYILKLSGNYATITF